MIVGARERADVVEYFLEDWLASDGAPDDASSGDANRNRETGLIRMFKSYRVRRWPQRFGEIKTPPANMRVGEEE